MANDILKFGKVKGPDYNFPINVTDSEAVNLNGGRFATRNASTGYAEVANTTEDLIGWLEPENVAIATDIETTSSSVMACYYSLDAIFCLPLAYDASSYTVNYAASIMFEACDLVVSSSVQYANPTAATNKSIIIVGGVAAAGTTLTNSDGIIYAMINPNARLDLGVGA